MIRNTKRPKRLPMTVREVAQLGNPKFDASDRAVGRNRPALDAGVGVALRDELDGAGRRASSRPRGA